MKELFYSLWNSETAAIRLVRAALMAYALYQVSPENFWTAIAGGSSLLMGSSTKKQ